MNSKIVINKKEIVYNNYDIIKQCINTTLDEEYDYIKVLENNNPEDSAIETFKKMANEHEELRRKFLDNNLNDFEIEEIGVIVKHRYSILDKKSKNLIKATKELKELYKKFI